MTKYLVSFPGRAMDVPDEDMAAVGEAAHAELAAEALHDAVRAAVGFAVEPRRVRAAAGVGRITPASTTSAAGRTAATARVRTRAIRAPARAQHHHRHAQHAPLPHSWLPRSVDRPLTPAGRWMGHGPGPHAGVQLMVGAPPSFEGQHDSRYEHTPFVPVYGHAMPASAAMSASIHGPSRRRQSQSVGAQVVGRVSQQAVAGDGSGG